jgi:hypothetical protein
VSITLPGSQSIPLIRAISTRSRSELLGCLCSNPVDLFNASYSANPLLSNLSAPSDQKDARIEGQLPAQGAGVEEQQKDSNFLNLPHE